MPLFFLLYDRLFDAGSDSSADIMVHIYYMIPFFIAVFFYASHLPERLLPGRYTIGSRPVFRPVIIIIDVSVYVDKDKSVENTLNTTMSYTILTVSDCARCQDIMLYLLSVS